MPEEDIVPQTTVYTQKGGGSGPGDLLGIIKKVVILVVLLLVVGGTIYAAVKYGAGFFSNSNNTQSSQQTATLPSPTPLVVDLAAKTYTNAENGFSIQYPVSWTKQDVLNPTTKSKIGVKLSGSEGDVTFTWGSTPSADCSQSNHVQLSLKAQTLNDACDEKQFNGSEVWSHIGQIVSSGVYLNITATANSPVDTNRQKILTILSSLTFFSSSGSSPQASYSDWNTYDSTCQFSINYPLRWNATHAQTATDTTACVYLTAPDYTNGAKRTGFYMSISRVAFGQSINGSVIRTLDEFVASQQAAVTTGKSTAKTIGAFAGQEFAINGADSLTDFVFTNGNYVYSVTWPSNYTGAFADSAESIISSIQF